jgi:predicted DNA-binding ribbon-helix-helix protein
MKSPKRSKYSIVKRTTRVAGRKTSISLEDHFFEALKEIAKERGSTWQDLVTSIDHDRGEGNLSSALRLFVLEYYQNEIAARTPSA